MQRHDDLPPLTGAQQAEVLRLAARLQAAHEAVASSESLLRAAAEAGIEERFVRQAARQVVETESAPRRSRRRGSGLPGPLVATTLLVVLDAMAMLTQSRGGVGIALEAWQIVLLVGAAFALSLWVGREPRVRWTTPVAVVAVWAALAFPAGIYHYALEGHAPDWIATLACLMGTLQLAAASIGAFLHWYRPRPLDLPRPL